MATPVANLNISNNTFQDLVNTLNTLCSLATNFMVTANTIANGSITTGNGFVNGIFGSNTLVCTNLRSGNVAGTGSMLNIFSPIKVGNTTQTDLSVSTTNTSLQTIDTYPVANNRTSKYLIQITCPTVGYQATELLVTHDGTNALITEYAQMISNTILGTFSALVSGGNFTLQIAPNNANNTINIYRTSMAV